MNDNDTSTGTLLMGIIVVLVLLAAGYYLFTKSPPSAAPAPSEATGSLQGTVSY